MEDGGRCGLLRGFEKVINGMRKLFSTYVVDNFDVFKVFYH